MHEIRLATDLARIVTDAAVREKLSRVTRVYIQFGEMIQVVPDIFRFAFAEAVNGTNAEHAEVDLEIIPIVLRCNKCLREIVINDLAFRCNHCDSVDLEIMHGKEMFITSLEGEK